MKWTRSGIWRDHTGDAEIQTLRLRASARRIFFILDSARSDSRLFRSTAEGTKRRKETQRYIEEGQKEIREAGGKIINAYALLGRYDYLYITEFPDQKKALKVLFKTAMKGRVAPESLVAMPLEEFL